MNLNESSEDWDEYGWERALRESDDYASRYMLLLKRFCDLPEANELIAERMGPDFRDKLPACELDCEDCDQRWQCEFGAPLDWTPPGMDDFGDADDDVDSDEPLKPGDALFYEADPTFNVLRQTALGWCNIHSVILPPESRRRGLRILYFIGRALANLSYSIGNGLYEQPAGSVAFAKRSASQVNAALGELQELIREKTRLARLLGAMQNHLLKARGAVVDHLQRCREELNKSAE